MSSKDANRITAEAVMKGWLETDFTRRFAWFYMGVERHGE